MKQLGYLYKPGTFEKSADIMIDRDLIIHVKHVSGKVIRYRYLSHAMQFNKGLKFIIL
jgi:hypothetical protein